jgi:hypothetical protein
MLVTLHLLHCHLMFITCFYTFSVFSVQNYTVKVHILPLLCYSTHVWANQCSGSEVRANIVQGMDGFSVAKRREGGRRNGLYIYIYSWNLRAQAVWSVIQLLDNNNGVAHSRVTREQWRSYGRLLGVLIAQCDFSKARNEDES